MPIASALKNWDLLSTSRVYSGLLYAFIADPHTPLYLIKPITHISVTTKKTFTRGVSEIFRRILNHFRIQVAVSLLNSETAVAWPFQKRNGYKLITARFPI
jgi:hypothetical protein